MFARSLLLSALVGCSGSGLRSSAEFDDSNTGRTCATYDRGVEGDFTWMGTWGDRPACTSASHAVGGVEGAVLRITLNFWTEGTAKIQLRNWNDDVLVEHTGVELFDSVDVTMPYGGEALLELTPEAGVDAGGSYGFEVDCIANCDGNWSKYPYFLLHGFASSGDTFERAVEIFSDAGFRTYAPSVSRFEPSMVRAAQIRDVIDAERADGSFRGVHLIGHSMGGMDARFLAANLDPDGLVKSITTLSTPHYGSPIADIALDLVGHNYSPEEVGRMIDAVVPDGSGTGPDGLMAVNNLGLVNTLYQLSTPGAQHFNNTVFDRDDVLYRSWGGMTCGVWQFGCQWDWGFEIVGLMLTPTHAVLRAQGLPSDGVVDVYSTMWGDFEGILAADHNEMSGGRFWSWPSFDDDGFFEREAYRLADWEHGYWNGYEPEAYTLDYLESNF